MLFTPLGLEFGWGEIAQRRMDPLFPFSGENEDCLTCCIADL